MPLVANAVYVDGKKRINPETLDQTFEIMRDSGGMGWIGLYRPDREEISAVEAEFGLHPLAVEDATNGHQRAKLERYEDTPLPRAAVSPVPRRRGEGRVR